MAEQKKHLPFEDVLYRFVYLYVSTTVYQELPYIIKKVDRSEELQSLQLINRRWGNPGPIEKLSLMVFTSL